MNHDSIVPMKKTEAINALGGSISDAARAIGVSYQAVKQWPDLLPRRIADRVEAALYRKLVLDAAIQQPTEKQ